MIDLNQNKVLLTKEMIHQHISDVDIYSKYIDEEIKIGAVILSPLRKEKNASFGFFKGRSGEICFKDYLLGAGDCFKFVQMKFNLTYFEAISKIAIDFEIPGNYICKSFAKTENNFSKTQQSREQLLNNLTTLKLGKNRREWQLHDIVFWEQFGISINTLKKFRVEPVSYYHINNHVIQADKHAYCFTELKDGIETYKFYQPFNEKYKWINGHNDSVWQGWDFLPAKGDDLIITKSLKDVMAIYEITGIPAISLQSETVTPKRHIFEELRSRFQVCYLLYDNDFNKEVNWGQTFAEKLAVDLGLINIFIDDKYQSKDFSDLVKNTNREQAKEILTETMMLPF